MRTLRSGRTIAVRGRPIRSDDLIGRLEGLSVVNEHGEPFLVLRPSYAELIPSLARRAQPIYPKDVGALLLWGDVGPGMRVIEVGTGAGALTLALLRAVGTTGSLTSYELREDFAAATTANVERHHGAAPAWTLRVQDAATGFVEQNVDRILVDLPEPWLLLNVVRDALRPGGILSCFLPTILQVKALADALEEHPAFGHAETIETFLREWQVRGRSVRPVHRMVAHTGLLVFARRLPTGADAQLTPSTPYSSETVSMLPRPGSDVDDEGGNSRDDLDSD
jgi:tRNA (adenine57-N1/adenine58-N1)-methyltransferase